MLFRSVIDKNTNGIHVFLNDKFKNFLIVINVKIPIQLEYNTLNNVEYFSEKFGIYNVIPFSSYSIIRMEGINPQKPQEVKFKYDPTFATSQSPLGPQQMSPITMNKDSKIEFDNYEMAHFRLLADTNFLPYGKAMIEGGRRV